MKVKTKPFTAEAEFGTVKTGSPLYLSTANQLFYVPPKAYQQLELFIKVISNNRVSLEGETMLPSNFNVNLPLEYQEPS